MGLPFFNHPSYQSGPPQTPLRKHKPTDRTTENGRLFVSGFCQQRLGRLCLVDVGLRDAALTLWNPVRPRAAWEQG